MSEEFDPYHIWLGISPDEQPVDHYRLLGVPRYESNAEVIQHAADRQMAHVRTFQNGRYSSDSQEVLNHLSMARACLLDPERKQPYDDELKQCDVPPAPPIAPPPVAVEPPPEPPETADDIPLSVKKRSSPLPSISPPTVANAEPVNADESPAVGVPTALVRKTKSTTRKVRARNRGNSIGIIVGAITALLVIILLIIISMLAK